MIDAGHIRKAVGTIVPDRPVLREMGGVMENLREKVVLITGAARGMGRLDALAFAREGCRVVMTDVDGQTLQDAAREMAEGGFEAHPFVLSRL